MEELINQLKAFLGERAQRIEAKGAAEIDIVVTEGYKIDQLALELEEQIINLVSEDTLAKINLLDQSKTVIRSFSLNQ
ncbi:hypothetical protein [Pedobacter endophyticus]|uniref:Uncharacterized protein n=1 Tax=Pedobacter endophyticus TaxID=2789740 RepID=A0A7S9L044_9SPHI|nr:hypothetical protein [Pedobacter endophyticus]QPH40019.1 hypothetical protein IZT61_01655 [Pedobacter endophyticus]